MRSAGRREQALGALLDVLAHNSKPQTFNPGRAPTSGLWERCSTCSPTTSPVSTSTASARCVGNAWVQGRASARGESGETVRIDGRFTV